MYNNAPIFMLGILPFLQEVDIGQHSKSALSIKATDYLKKKIHPVGVKKIEENHSIKWIMSPSPMQKTESG